MSGKFFGVPSGTTTVKDFAEIFASTVGTRASWSTESIINNQIIGPFNAVGESYNQAGGSDTVNVTVDGFKHNGTSITGVKIGYLPTKNGLITNLHTAGSYTMKRTDAALTFYKDGVATVTVTKDKFRDGVVPYRILVVACGGGGGAGGSGSKCNSKDNFTQKIGGAGGGAGVAAIRLDLSNSITYGITIGDYGKWGSNNTTTEGKSTTTGTAGGTGGTTILNDGSVNLIVAYGGGGGGAGGENHGSGGSGGSASVNTTKVSCYKTATGGKGNCVANISQSGISAVTITPTSNTGVGAITMSTYKDNNASTKNQTTAGNELVSGGCSYGHGEYFINNQINQYNAGNYGGGACASSKNCGGGNSGAMLFYY
jgi:hypothetical protein